MIKRVLPLLFIFAFTNYVGAQTESDDAKTENVIRVNFLNPSLTIERALSSKTTFEAGVGFGYNGS